VNKSSRKTSVTKVDKDIEFCLGDAGPTKYKIMSAIAKKYSVYGATVWLNEPSESLGGKTPAELMLKGEFEAVAKLIKDSQGDGERGI
tara:strand:+ start:304 stop:567 length:264 start_codon:yes stop_codon:yes gene_type:complete